MIIFRDRELIIFKIKNKACAKEKVEKWNLLVKVSPKETMAPYPISFYYVKEFENFYALNTNIDMKNIK